MKLSLLTRSSVLDAIAECNRLGREPFLKEYEFARAREYFLLHAGRAYDSKAIVGVAYAMVTGERLTARDFSGGKWLADRLLELDFEMTGDMDWQVEEQILACDLLVHNGWKTIPEADPRTAALSELLRSQWVYAPSIPEYRSRNSVHRKIEDLRTARPGHAGTATRGGQLSARIAVAFTDDPARMHALAVELRAGAQLDLPMQYGTTDDDAPPAELDVTTASDFAAAVEGKAVRRMTNRYERDRKLRAQKIAQSRQQRGGISCEICGFDFEKFYPGLGDGYIHVHHVVPLHKTGEVRNTLDDLVLVCANCHQMIHRPAQYLTPAQLAQIIGAGTNAAEN